MNNEANQAAGSVAIAGIDKSVSRLALGSAFYNPEDKDPWFDVLDEFVGRGGTVLDTGRHYGRSEDVLGLWLASRGARDRVIVITKGGHGQCHGLSADDFAPTIEEELTTSLERLNTDYVDLYMLHRDSPTVPVADIMNYLNSHVERGRVRALGASNWEYHRVKEANAYAGAHGLKGFAAVSNHISLAEASGPFFPGLISAGEDGERWHSQTGIPLIAWSSQARGFFTGRYSKPPDPQDSFAVRMAEIYCTEDNFERLRRATEFGKEKGGYSAIEVALAWLLQKPFPLVPIVGPHNKKELQSCFQALSISMSPREAAWLNLEE